MSDPSARRISCRSHFAFGEFFPIIFSSRVDTKLEDAPPSIRKVAALSKMRPLIVSRRASVFMLLMCLCFNSIVSFVFSIVSVGFAVVLKVLGFFSVGLLLFVTFLLVLVTDCICSGRHVVDSSRAAKRFAVRMLTMFDSVVAFAAERTPSVLSVSVLLFGSELLDRFRVINLHWFVSCFFS